MLTVISYTDVLLLHDSTKDKYLTIMNVGYNLLQNMGGVLPGQPF